MTGACFTCRNGVRGYQKVGVEGADQAPRALCVSMSGVLVEIRDLFIYLAVFLRGLGIPSKKLPYVPGGRIWRLFFMDFEVVFGE